MVAALGTTELEKSFIKIFNKITKKRKGGYGKKRGQR